MFRFSVITICFNVAEDLKRTIDSVNEQTYAEIEHIIVDGGSKDGTVELIQRLARRNVQWVSERDEGIADAFNKGTAMATGDYLCYLNAGDTFVSKTTIADVAGNINTGLSISGQVFVGDFICETDDGPFLTKAQIDLNAFRYSNPINHQSVFIPHSVAEKYPYDKGLTLGMDYDLWLRCLREGVPFGHLPIPIARFFANGRSSNPSWAVHNMIVREIVWLKHAKAKLSANALARIWVRVLALRLRLFGRRLVGRSAIRFFKKVGLRRRGRFSRMTVQP